MTDLVFKTSKMPVTGETLIAENMKNILAEKVQIKLLQHQDLVGM